MKVKKTDKDNGTQPNTKSFNYFYIGAAGFVIILIILFLAWQNITFQENSPLDVSDKNSNPDILLDEEKDTYQTSPAAQSSTITKNVMVADPPEAPEPTNSLNGPVVQNREQIEENSSIDTNPPQGNDSQPVLPQLSSQNEDSTKKDRDPSVSQQCEQLTKKIEDFYLHLDNADYIQNYNLQSSSEQYFNNLIRNLLDNPPVVSGETSDLFTILQNTAHFFRIIGKDNISMLKAILDREKETFEYVLADYYDIIHIPGCADKSFSLQHPLSSFYDYAGFFLNTMGGRLYLFRRDSMSRMVVSYYAILLIDHANKTGSNSHGIDIRPPLDLLIKEIESTANTLQLKETYLDTLYNLKEEYQ